MANPVWEVTPGLTAYPAALTRMQGIAAGIRAGSESERIWLVEHPPLYTAGTSADPMELIDPERFPVFNAGRGGITAGNYLVFDTVFSYPLEVFGYKMSTTLNVNNAFDKKYSEGDRKSVV